MAFFMQQTSYPPEGLPLLAKVMLTLTGKGTRIDRLFI